MITASQCRAARALTEHVEPRAGQRIAFDPLDANIDGSAASDTQTPDRIFFEVEADDGRLAGGDHTRRGVGNGGFEAAT